MSPGGPDDVRLDARQVAARLGVTPRHLARIASLVRPHYVNGLKRYWLSEIVAWEEAHTTSEPPSVLRRGTPNLRRGHAAALTTVPEGA